MPLEAWFTIVVVLCVFSALMFTKVGADLIMLAGLAALITIDALSDQITIFSSPAAALAGFANEGTITVGVLFVVAAAIRETGGLSSIAQKILNRPRSLAAAQTRMMLPTAFMSAVMNNTRWWP